jgi:hypothetical protein
VFVVGVALSDIRYLEVQLQVCVCVCWFLLEMMLGSEGMFKYKEREEKLCRSFVERGLRFVSVTETARLSQELIELLVVQTSIDEFFSTENTIGVLVHHAKDVQCTFIGFDLSFMLIRIIADQFVDGLEDDSSSRSSLFDTYADDASHFCFVDRSITIAIVHSKGHVEFLVGCALRCDVDRLEEFFEINLAAVV